MRNKKQKLVKQIDLETGEEIEVPVNYTYPKIWNSLTTRYRSPYTRQSKMPSMTVPDQSLSIREILERHTSGIGIDGQRVSIFEEDENEAIMGINPYTLDLVDIQRLKIMTNERIEEIKNQAVAEIAVKKEQSKERRRLAQEAEEKRFQEAIKASTIKS